MVVGSGRLGLPPMNPCPCPSSTLASDQDEQGAATYDGVRDGAGWMWRVGAASSTGRQLDRGGDAQRTGGRARLETASAPLARSSASAYEYVTTLARPGQARPGPGWPRVAQTHNGEMARLPRKPIDNAAGPKEAQGKVRRRNHALRFSSFPTLSTIFLGGTKGRGGQWKRHQTPKGGAAAAAAPQTTKKEGRGRLMQERARCSCHYCTARC